MISMSIVIKFVTNFYTSLLILVLLLSGLTAGSAAAAPGSGITFPVLGGGSFSNDFNAYRSLNGIHHATDIFAAKHTPIVSPVDGTVYYVMNPQPNWGWSVGIRDSDGFEYNFLHMNNDNNGTDDGAGGPMQAYAFDMKTGNKVVKGQHLGWVGDSGNAETTPPHLHFEIYDTNDNAVNPYDYLINAPRINSVVTNPSPQTGESIPFGPNATNGVSIASGNLGGSADKEYVIGAKNGYPQVRTYNQDDSVRSWGFPAYAANYTGGINVAMGDVDGDGIAEIITGTNPGSTTHVRIFKENGTEVGSFFAYDGYYTGVNVAAADMDGDGKAEIITGTGPGSTTHVKVFKPNGQYVNGFGFFAYPGYYIGADVAAGDVDGDGQNDIVTSTNEGSTPHIKVFSKLGEYKYGFFAYDNFYGGAQVAVANIKTNTAKDEIITTPRSNGGPDFRVFNEQGQLLSYKSAWETWWSGNYEVAPFEDGKAKISTGQNRRSSIRNVQF